ncbi:imidazoleglycerol-phosphate dehydratase HisB [Qipengyuania sp. DY56-A-20]|jgi:imidazoleglycerol-phosphate dehydratase|uniref:Imidazoleglycerol-phosphate dehydratase n=1 Tax=Qipengyuania benthica TaxID=3067651 RepID=A0ABT9H604_9SPHN|nr:imidazoleglycerol-phosphate dehydratase HisB [Qipengyuania sp. DY56-A-20]MBU1254130.1 imidazoleglycerol-phosphate dehydratase HisB [Alphaproteobacteria bacterium]MBU1606439.1 imidazoleglycerol-phosphate dehydratase HisB [Alphaproteobacteria bacterium]MDP4538738.1 imidazoleglycerol-phosphate dehydratase HisB [Qipengyuania sp. DY56-A-20]
MRTATIERKTTETAIHVTVDLDGTGAYAVETGIGFLDHMVEQFSRHSLIDVTMKVAGDLHVDQHHTTEDSAIALGQALAQALGDKGGIARYGTAYSPMDETLARVALDISGRPYLVWKAGFTQEKLGEWDTELIEHWFHSVAQAAGITLHCELLYGQNNHHICEALYKGFARAMRQAVEIDPRKGGAVPSTKGQLGG